MSKAKILKAFLFLAAFMGVSLTACQSAPEQSVETETAVSPIDDATEPATLPTEMPVQTASEPRAVMFSAADGETLSGTLYGAGSTGIIFSNMNQGDETAWQGLPEAVQENGYTALTYNYRTLGRSAEERAQKMEDLRAAIAFMRSEEITEIVLVGASVGGSASVKVAVEEQPVGLIVISSPMILAGLEITADDLQTISSSKLFLNSERDMFGTTPDSEMMFEAASEPKAMLFYSGSAHGTGLLTGEHQDAFIQQIVSFIDEIAE
ncbi:MAG: alpha/beta family hydrolase [Chloroflexota bacterium]